jgi:hypothetical protein
MFQPHLLVSRQDTSYVLSVTESLRGEPVIQWKAKGSTSDGMNAMLRYIILNLVCN